MEYNGAINQGRWKMTKADIKRWIAYWTAADMVAFDEIRTFNQMVEARKYCSCLRVGVFADVTDLQLWNALRDYRANCVVDPLGCIRDSIALEKEGA